MQKNTESTSLLTESTLDQISTDLKPNPPHTTPSVTQLSSQSNTTATSTVTPPNLQEHKHHPGCTHHHTTITNEQSLHQGHHNPNCTHHHNLNHNKHNHTHIHSENCKFHHHHNPQQQQTLPINFIPSITQTDLTIDKSISLAVLKYLSGDLHRTWTILDKLQKANLVDKKLEGVFILKQLGLNKGVAPLKCLTSNNGDITKTLADLKVKTEEQAIQYISSIPEDCKILIDGLSLAGCDEEIKTMCISNAIDLRQLGIIKMYMLIETLNGMFFIPKEYINPQVLVKISTIVNNLKNKSQHPLILKLSPVEGEVEKNIIKVLEEAKEEEIGKIIVVTNDKLLIKKCLNDHKQVKLMRGEVLIKIAIEKQSKDYVEEILFLK